MTHSGGKPHAVGDRGQRYEVSYFDPNANSRQVYGWTDKSEGAERILKAIKSHPNWTHGQIRDRVAEQGAEQAAAEAGHIYECPGCGKDIADYKTEHRAGCWWMLS